MRCISGKYQYIGRGGEGGREGGREGKLGGKALPDKLSGIAPIPGTTWQDGVRFEEVSLGYPEELEIRPDRPRSLRQVFPVEPAVPQDGTTIAVASSA
jgi:hypothetical protein